MFELWVDGGRFGGLQVSWQSSARHSNSVFRLKWYSLSYYITSRLDCHTPKTEWGQCSKRRKGKRDPHDVGQVRFVLSLKGVPTGNKQICVWRGVQWHLQIEMFWVSVLRRVNMSPRSDRAEQLLIKMNENVWTALCFCTDSYCSLSSGKLCSRERNLSLTSQTNGNIQPGCLMPQKTTITS